MRVLLVAALAVAAFAGGTAYATDTTPPGVTLTTRDYDVLVGGVEPLGATGTASDDTSVARVEVRFCNGGKSNGGYVCGSGIGGLRTVVTVQATLTCEAARHSCTWAAAAPLQPDTYLVFATAYDSAGHSTTVPEPALVIVV